MQHMGVCPSSETRRKRDQSEGEKKGEHYGVSPFSGDDVDFCAGFVSEQEVRASERASRARPRMREICFFLWEGQPKDPEGPTGFQYASWCRDASSLDKEDGWEFAYLLHVTCAHWSVGPHAWAPHVSDRPVDVKTRLIIILLHLYKVSYGFKGTKAKLNHLHDIIFSMKPS